mmetsp:Transcript_7717/g.12828  ORF Transcript_7717/g.12828 Transcript_7717/m.12828 type:complete len:98 (-) Transcript_7717:33-326(-)
MPPASQNAIVTFQPFALASCSAAAMALSTAADVRLIVAWRDGSPLDMPISVGVRVIAEFEGNRQKEEAGRMQDSSKIVIITKQIVGAGMRIDILLAC